MNIIERVSQLFIEILLAGSFDRLTSTTATTAANIAKPKEKLD
jgi:hypothetical protein